MPFYAVHKGKVPGVYQDWASCKKQIDGCKGPVFRKFETYELAEQFVKTGVDPIKTARALSVPSVPTDAPASVVCYTDGASSKNGNASNARAGYGVHFIVGSRVARSKASGTANASFGGLIDISARLRVDPQTNQRAELMAIMVAIESVNNIYGLNVPITICSDSMYSINCCTKWSSGWISNGWNTKAGKEVKNQDIIRPLVELVNERNKDPSFASVKFIHVKGHSGIEGNEIADKLAVAGAKID